MLGASPSYSGSSSSHLAQSAPSSSAAAESKVVTTFEPGQRTTYAASAPLLDSMSGTIAPTLVQAVARYATPGVSSADIEKGLRHAVSSSNPPGVLSLAQLQRSDHGTILLQALHDPAVWGALVRAVPRPVVTEVELPSDWWTRHTDVQRNGLLCGLSCLHGLTQLHMGDIRGEIDLLALADRHLGISATIDGATTIRTPRGVTVHPSLGSTFGPGTSQQILGRPEEGPLEIRSLEPPGRVRRNTRRMNWRHRPWWGARALHCGRPWVRGRWRPRARHRHPP
jgi:hypothetical protein